MAAPAVAARAAAGEELGREDGEATRRIGVDGQTGVERCTVPSHDLVASRARAAKTVRVRLVTPVRPQ